MPWLRLMLQGDTKDEEDMSVDSDEEPESYPLPTPVSQAKNTKPPPTKLRVSCSILNCVVLLSGTFADH